MVPKILRPVRQKDIFRKKYWMQFNLQVPVGFGMPLHSDFIYSTKILDEEMFRREDEGIQDFEYCPIINKIKDEANRNIFAVEEIDGFNKKDLNPPTHIERFKFSANLGLQTKEYMTMISAQNPLNITFETTYALAKYFNSRNIQTQMNDFLIFFSRIPIFIQRDVGEGKITYATNLQNLFSTLDVMGFWFEYPEPLNLPELTAVKGAFKKLNGRIWNQGRRQRQENENDNMVYDMNYSEGRFLGVDSPQPVDWYMNTIENPRSSFNNSSMIKCIMTMCMLGAMYNNTNYYTLTNAAVFATYEGNGSFKFTGKYLTNINYSPTLFLNANEREESMTYHILEYVYNTFRNLPDIRDQIERETNFEFHDWVEMPVLNQNYAYLGQQRNIHVLYTCHFEMNQLGDASMQAAVQINKLVRGLEDFYKNNMALWITGIWGLYFDKVLKFFPFEQTNEINATYLSVFEKINPNFGFITNYGSPLAIWCKFFKVEAEKNILLGYNLGNLSKLIELGAISIQDNISYNNTFIASKNPIGLYPVCYNNVNFTCSIYCWRSWKTLFKQCNTRKKRDQLFDYLNNYGKKAMTIMDPYGIFLHFHNSTRGLKPADEQNEGN